jgi:hypothetical protein
VLDFWAAAFRHVQFRGDIGRVMMRARVGPWPLNPAEQRLFDEANESFYANTDWALDISEARFEECDVRAVPATLIRRDRDSQVIVRRDRLLSGSWREIDLSETWWGVALQGLLKDERDDEVLVAPKRHPKYRALLAGLQRLRDAGIAEPD